MIVIHLVAYILFALCSSLIAERSVVPVDTFTVAHCIGAVPRCDSGLQVEPVISYNRSVETVWRPMHHTFPVVGVR